MSTALPFVMVFPRGQLSAKDKERLTKGGIIAVEADDPAAVCQLHLSAPLISTNLSGDAIVRAALDAMALRPERTTGGSITEAGMVKCEFVRLLAESLKDRK